MAKTVAVVSFGNLAAWGGALLLSVVAVTSLAYGPELIGSHRWPPIVLGLALPAAGAFMLRRARAAGGARRDHATALDERGAEPDEAFDEGFGEGFGKGLGDVLPAPEMLVAGAEGRRALLRRLRHRGDAEAVALLRWALSAAPVALGLEAGLALQHLSRRFQKRLDQHRQALRSPAPAAADALAAGNLIAHGFETGILGVARVRSFASEARDHYEQALRLDPSALSEVALGLARLEMAILRADRALDVLDRALAAPNPARLDELRALREEAALRSHALPTLSRPTRTGERPRGRIG